MATKVSRRQILVPQRLIWIVEDVVETEHVADFELKGFHHPVPVYNLVRLKA